MSPFSNNYAHPLFLVFSAVGKVSRVLLAFTVMPPRYTV